MTDKLIMTTAQRDEILHALSVPEHADEGENAAAIAMLQSLSMVTDTPCGFVRFGIDETTPLGISDFNDGTVFKSPVYISPQAHTLLNSEPEAEARAWEISYKNPETGDQKTIVFMHNAIGDYRMFDPDATSEPLYKATSPQAHTEISADDVTDEMRETFNMTHMPFGPDREIMAAAYNAVIQHRSEAK